MSARSRAPIPEKATQSSSRHPVVLSQLGSRRKFRPWRFSGLLTAALPVAVRTSFYDLAYPRACRRRTGFASSTFSSDISIAGAVARRLACKALSLAEDSRLNDRYFTVAKMVGLDALFFFSRV